LLDFTKYPEIFFSLDPGNERQIFYYFAEENGVLHMWQYAGDPDAWKYMEFVRAAG
jgi:hypothetical protein